MRRRRNDKKTMSKKRKYQRHKTKELSFYKDECFNMYQTFARVALINLKKLRAMAIGVPCDLCFDGEKELSVDEGMKRWHKMLDKMIWSFDEIAHGNKHEPTYHAETQVDGKWVESKKHKKYRKRVNEGLDLFRDRFFDLVMY